jgi:PAS domain S-box-containing protein
MMNNQLLHVSEDILQTVFESTSEAIFVVDIDNNSIVECNSAAVDLVGYTRDELLSMPAAELHPHNFSEFMGFVETVFAEGRGTTDSVTCYHKAGRIIPAEMSASILEIDGREYLVNIIRDSSDSEERDWFESLIEHSQDLITVLTTDGEIQYQSPSATHITGYEPFDLRDKQFLQFIHTDDRDDVRTVFDTLPEDAITDRLEYRFRRADGSWAWFESIGSYRSDETIGGYIINSRDITARKESQQQAAVLNRVIRHNLRNELNVIIALAEQLTRKDDDKTTTYAETILDRAWELQDAASYTSVLTDILESDHVNLQVHDVTVSVQSITARLRSEWPEVDIEVSLPEQRRVTAAPKLDIAVEHVLENALEHNDSPQPRVEVSLREPATEAGYVELTVTDNGPGIPEHEQKVLLDGEESPLEHGSGLGLWIVNWIVTRSGGRIAFDDNEPRGSRVTIALPPVGE